MDNPLLSYIDVRHLNFLPPKFTVGEAQDLCRCYICSDELAPIRDESAELASCRPRELAHKAVQQKEPAEQEALVQEAEHTVVESSDSSRTHPAHGEEMVTRKTRQLASLFLVHVRPRSSSHLRGVARPLLPILLPLLPPHELAKDHGLQNRHLPA